MTTTSQFLSLPNEILILILSFLPLRSITACKRSCCRLRAVIKCSGLLRCRMRTMKSFMEDLSPPGLTTSDFLDNLKTWEKAWLTFGVGSEVVTRTTYKPLMGPSEFLLRSGYLIEMHHGITQGWSYLDLHLPHNHGGQSAPQWTDVQLGTTFRVNGWALDVDQDLLAVSTISLEARKRCLEIRLLHFTTGTHHQSAAIPVIRPKFEGKEHPFLEPLVEVMGDKLIVLLSHGSLFRHYQTLYLIDWVRGQVKCRRRISAGTYFPVLASISNDILVLGRRRDWALELCKITKGDGDDSLTFRTLYILKLPPLHPKAYIELTSISRRTSCTPPSPALFLPRPSMFPFRSSPSDSILTFAVNVHRTEKSSADFRKLYFYALPDHLRLLVEGIAGCVTRKRSSNDVTRNFPPSWLHRRTDRAPPSAPIVMSWDEWGPTTTRWFTGSVTSMRHTLSGMRCAITESGKWKLRILDFNPGRLGRVVAVREPGKDGKKVQERLAVTNSSVLPAGLCFQRDVTSSLPYYELKRCGVKGSFLMDDEWIAEIKRDVVSESVVHAISVRPVVGGGA